MYTLGQTANLQTKKRFTSDPEPFDPEYIHPTWEVPRISDPEMQWLAAISLIEKGMHQRGWHFRFDQRTCCFIVKKSRMKIEYGVEYDQTELNQGWRYETMPYPPYRRKVDIPAYIMLLCYYQEENQFAFGGETTDLCVGTLPEVLDAVGEWLENKEPSLP